MKFQPGDKVVYFGPDTRYFNKILTIVKVSWFDANVVQFKVEESGTFTPWQHNLRLATKLDLVLQ